MRRKLCFGLLLVCSIIFGLSLSVSSDVNAASQQWTSNWAIKDGSGWAGSTAGNFVAISGGFQSTEIRYNNANSLSIASGKVVTFSATFISLFDYASSGINSPLQMSCPQFIADVTTLDCEISSSVDVSGGQHFIIYTWTYSGYMYGSWDQTTARFSTFIRNNTSGGMRIYSTGLTVNIGDSESTPTVQAIRSFNQDVSSYIGSVISSNNSNFNNLESVIQSFNTDFNNYRTNTFNQLNSISTNVTNIWNYLQDKQDEEEEDRDNVEQQSSDINSDSSDSASDAQQQGTTLLGAFSAFVTALTSASPSNCVLDMDLGNLDLGNVDFCTLSPPQPVPTIASIFLILFCVPLSIATAKKVINLFRSFQ